MSDEQKNVENNTELKPKGLNKKLILGIACIIALVVVVALAILLPKTATAKKVSKQLSLGEKYLSELDYEQAIAAYELAIKIDPKNEDAYIGLAEVYIAMGDLDKAEEVLKDGKRQATDTKKIREKLKEVEKKKDGSDIQPTEVPEPGDGTEPTKTPGTGDGAEPTGTEQGGTPIPKPTPTPEPAPVGAYGEGELVDLKNASVGNRVLFGFYEQDADISNGAEPIEWYVLDKQGDAVLLLSRYILDEKQYNKEATGVTWETCTLRSWLNDEFFNVAFNGTEKGYIRQVTLDNPDNPFYGTRYGAKGGNVTEDRVFLLSLDELRMYFSFAEYEGERWEYDGDTRLLAHGTRQAYENDLYLYDIENNTSHFKSDGYEYSQAATGWWWLRSPGYFGDYAASVDNDGGANLYGHHGYGYNGGVSNGGVRPALWLNLNQTAAPEPTPTPEPASVGAYGEGELADLKNASVGNRVLFGSYEQDADISNGAEPIEWYVLDKQGDAVLLLSRYILDAKPYNKEYTGVTWENCTLRSWLNGEFYNMAFTSTEKGYIRQVTLDNPDNPFYGTKFGSKGGNATEDRVFLLSLDELRRYFSFAEYYGDWLKYGEDDTRILAHRTRQAYNDLYLYEVENYGKEGGYDYSPAVTAPWWLRSPGGSCDGAAGVSDDGDAVLGGWDVSCGSLGVRPALWLNLNP